MLPITSDHHHTSLSPSISQNKIWIWLLMVELWSLSVKLGIHLAYQGFQAKVVRYPDPAWTQNALNVWALIDTRFLGYQWGFDMMRRYNRETWRWTFQFAKLAANFEMRSWTAVKILPLKFRRCGDWPLAPVPPSNIMWKRRGFDIGMPGSPACSTFWSFDFKSPDTVNLEAEIVSIS